MVQLSSLIVVDTVQANHTPRTLDVSTLAATFLIMTDYTMCDGMPNTFQAIYCRKGVKLQLIKAKPGIHGLHSSLYTDTKHFHKTWLWQTNLYLTAGKQRFGNFGNLGCPRVTNLVQIIKNQ